MNIAVAQKALDAARAPAEIRAAKAAFRAAVNAAVVPRRP